MDHIHSRKLEAASRRRKMMEHSAAEIYERRRASPLPNRYSSEEESSDEEGSTYSPIPDSQSDAQSRSTHSSHRKQKSKSSLPSTSSFSLPFLASEVSKPHIPEIDIAAPLSSDFESFQIKPLLQQLEDSLAEVDPSILIATTIIYSTPPRRPSVISIKARRSSRDRLSPSQRPPSTPTADRRGSALSWRSARSNFDIPAMPDLKLVDLQTLEAESRRPSHTVAPPPIVPTASYDIFPRRTKHTSPQKSKQPMASQNPSINPLNFGAPPPIPTSKAPLDSDTRSLSTPRKRRSSIGMALKSASSTLRGKGASRPPTASSSYSSDSRDGTNSCEFPVPSIPQETKSFFSSSGEGRRKSLRSVVGF